MPLELTALLPATALAVVLLVYLRAVLQPRRLITDRPQVYAPDVTYAVVSALRGEPLLLTVCWACLVTAVRLRVRRAGERVVARLTPIESHDRLAQWWATHVATTRTLARYEAYRPRHSREALEVDLLKSDVADIVWSVQFRTYWAEWPTQLWPCLATGGSAYETVDCSTSIESFAR